MKDIQHYYSNTSGHQAEAYKCVMMYDLGD